MSVIVPVYKVEPYLDKCIGSIVNQTYQNLEIILVDDGSPDRCPQICDQWAARDSRIKVIHKENGGLSDARNAGLDICTGAYVVFVDSDDYVDREYVSYLYELVTKNRADLAICAFRYEKDNGAQIDSVVSDGEIYVMDQCRALKEMCDSRLFSNSACAKIYPRTFFDSIRFPVGHIYEDLAVAYKLFLKAQTVVFGQRALYHYIRNEASITKSTFSWKQLDAVTYGEEMCAEIRKQWPELFAATQKRLFAIYVYCWRSVALAHLRTKESKQLKNDLYEKIKAVRKDICRNELSLKMRCYLIGSYFGKMGMELCFQVENKLYQLIKLR